MKNKILLWTIGVSIIIVIGYMNKPKETQAYVEEEPEEYYVVIDLKNPQYRMIAKVIAAEACGEDWEGMVRVANVIDNRAKKYHKSHYQIVTQPHQFSGYTARNRDKIYSQCEIDANTIAVKMLKGELRDRTNGALYFENIKAFGTPKWAKNKKITHKYGNHIFYK